MATIFVDLARLRMGVLLKIDPQKNVDGRYVIKYRKFNSFTSQEIFNIPKEALISVANTEIGNMGDADNYVFLLKSESNDAPFLEGILQKKYSDMIAKVSNLKKELEIKKGLDEVGRIQESAALTTKLKDFASQVKEMNKIVKSPDKDRFGRRSA